MARLRDARTSSTPPSRLNERGPDAWLTADNIDAMLELRRAALELDGFARWKVRRRQYDLFHGAWGFAGTDDELLAYWAEERRYDACRAWVRAAPGRSIEPFEPFAPDWKTFA